MKTQITQHFPAQTDADWDRTSKSYVHTRKFPCPNCEGYIELYSQKQGSWDLWMSNCSTHNTQEEILRQARYPYEDPECPRDKGRLLLRNSWKLLCKLDDLEITLCIWDDFQKFHDNLVILRGVKDPDFDVDMSIQKIRTALHTLPYQAEAKRKLLLFNI